MYFIDNFLPQLLEDFVCTDCRTQAEQVAEMLRVGKCSPFKTAFTYPHTFQGFPPNVSVSISLREGDTEIDWGGRGGDKNGVGTPLQDTIID